MSEEDRQTVEIINDFKPFVKDISSAKMSEISLLHLLTISGFVKSFELCIDVFKFNNNNQSVFFIIPALRGVCEDLISLNYFQNVIDKEDQDKLLYAFMLHSVNNGILKQTSFFQKNRPHQPVIRNDNINLDVEKELKKNKNDIKQFKGKYDWNRNYPSVYERAKATNYTELYDFLYAATSRAVHFEPQLLARMGWTDSLDEEIDSVDQKNLEYNFTTENFSHFYQLFCEFYSVYLFSNFCSDFSKSLNFENDFSQLETELDASLNDYPRWPEIVTFEEMNIKKPSDIIYILSNVMHQNNND